MSGQYRNPINLGLPSQPLLDLGKEAFQDINLLQQACQNLADAIDLYTPRRGYIASEAILYGAAVNLYNNAGVPTIRNASASLASKLCHGWLVTKTGVAIGKYGEFIVQGTNPTLSGLTNGATYYLQNAAGTIGLAAGTVSQKVGFALSTTEVFFRSDIPA